MFSVRTLHSIPLTNSILLIFCILLDQGADILEFGFENALRVFLVETQKCMVSEDPQGCELEKAQTLCWDIAEHVPEQEQGGDPCACFDTSERYVV